MLPGVMALPTRRSGVNTRSSSGVRELERVRGDVGCRAEVDVPKAQTARLDGDDAVVGRDARIAGDRHPVGIDRDVAGTGEQRAGAWRAEVEKAVSPGRQRDVAAPIA